MACVIGEADIFLIFKICVGKIIKKDNDAMFYPHDSTYTLFPLPIFWKTKKVWLACASHTCHYKPPVMVS